MTWLSSLLQTYENHLSVVGQFEKKRNGREYALIPVSHTTQSAHIEIHISVQGDYLWAKVVDKDDASTIIPCTEKSANRTSAPEPYPLFDKLVYVAGDYPIYCGPTKGMPHRNYLDNLRAWCESTETHERIKSVYAYVSKGTLIADLIRHGILWVDTHGKLLGKWSVDMGEKPEIFRVLAGDQESAFVRFAVDDPGTPESRLWRDRSVQEAFIRYHQQLLSEEDLCYATGEIRPYAEMHSSRIRNSGDKAKLISSNDTSGFTFRGRFQTSNQAAVLSYEVSQKAHNALKWLVDRQASLVIDGRVFLVWGTDRLDLPDTSQDSFDLYNTGGSTDVELSGDSTHREYAKQIEKAINGYRYSADYRSRAIVMVLDAATPGRMSVVYYRDLELNPFLDKLQHWHVSCSWLHQYRKNDEGKYTSFYGAPATKDIAFAAYGSRADDRIVKGLLERMLPCIIDGIQIPRDILRSAVHRASNPVGMENWEWEKTLSVTCALINKFHEQEGFAVALDELIDDRSYLFGRLLAIADVLERSALEENRASNAIRYMNAFARYPARTWGIIQSNIQPYQAKLGTRVSYHNQLIDTVGSMLKPEDFNDQPLGDLYLLGFYSQRRALYTKRDTKTEVTQTTNETTTQEEM